MLDLVREFEAGSKRLLMAHSQGSWRPVWAVRDKNCRVPWDQNLEELRMPNVEVYES